MLIKDLIVLSHLDSILNNPKSRYRLFWILAVVAIISLYLTLNLPYLGEEGQYTFPTLEMWYHHYYWAPIATGTIYPRPPLFNWLTLPLAHLLGGEHILIAARFITATATAGTGILLWWFTERIFHDKTFAILTILVYLSGDLLFRRGWITYADPTFAFFIFGAIAFLWVAVTEERIAFLMPAVFFIICAFLTKALTAYLFYGLTALVLMYRSKKQWFLLKPSSLILHAIALAIPLIWLKLAPGETSGHMALDISRRITALNWTYPIKLIKQPLVHLLRLAPMSLLGIYYAWQTRKQPATKNSFLIQTIIWVVLLNYVVYWLPPQWSGFRYLLPIVPLIAIIFAYYIWNAGDAALRLSTWVIIFFLAVKLISCQWGLPWFERMSYAYPAIAKDIMATSNNYPLYAVDSTSSGLSVIATIDAIRWPKAPILWPPEQWNNGFIISESNNPVIGKRVKCYDATPRDHIYLLCRGAACKNN